jgi:hypothetical protein
MPKTHAVNGEALEAQLAKVTQILKEIHDEADHILETEAEKPLEVARVNAKVIRKLAKEAITELKKGS